MTTAGRKRTVSMVAVGALAVAGLTSVPAAAGTRHGAADLAGRPLSAVATGTRVASSLAPAVTGKLTRMAIIGTSRQGDPSYSTNWSGIAGTASAGVVKGALGSWVVPRVKAPAGSLYASTWVGVDGVTNSDLIQTGTDEDDLGGKAFYAAWIEILPAASQIIGNAKGPAVVKPGDVIHADVQYKRSRRWQIYIADVTRKWYYERTFTYGGPGTSAEWIEEAPTVDGSQSRIADFGSVAVKNTAVYIKGKNGKLGWYSTALGKAAEIDLRQRGKIYATPTEPLPRLGSSTGQHFTVRYR